MGTKEASHHSLRAHAILGASSSKRWLNCPGSVELIKKAPKPPSSAAAEEGTAAHELAEKVLLQTPNANFYVGKEKINGFEVTREMADGVNLYCDYVLSRKRELGAELSVEERFDLSWVYPGMFGTNDACLRQEFGMLEVIDFKYGAGMAVEVEENTQLIYYALGAARGGEFETVRLTIVQPRCEHDDGPIRSWDFPASELMEWAKKFKAGAIVTEAPQARLADGEWCHFCAAAGTCPHLYKKSMKNAMADFDQVPVVPKLTELTDEQLLKVLTHKKDIESFLNKVKSYARERIRDGRPIKGTKLVEGRGSRRWLSEESAIEYLEEKLGRGRAYEKKVLSVAKAEALVGKNDLESLWVRHEGAPTVTHEGDKRRAISATPQEDFKQIGPIEINEEDF